MIRPIPEIIPPGGFVFFERRGVMLTADSFAGLVTKLTEHRVNNRYPLGDPESEAAQAICSRYPAFCTDRIPHSGGLTDATLAARVLSWSTALGARRGSAAMPLLSSADVVSARASVCAACPHARKPTASVPDAHISSIRLALTRDAGYPNLGYCAIFFHDNATACHLASDPGDTAHAPAECWAKQVA